jgi:hypothetical protein
MIINELKKIQNKNATISIAHKLYGNQNIKVAFQLLNTEKRLGFLIGEQEIYIEKDKISRYGIEDNEYYFADEIMEIRIKLHGQ